LSTFKQQIGELKLVPAGGGCFELSAEGDLVYSKLETGKFPDEPQIIKAIGDRLKAAEARPRSVQRA
jgi:selenoprotein W-related protein